MRKVFLFCALVAGFAMMIGCQKEQDVVTLKAVISQDTKTYIGTIGTALYPFWNDGDAVRINGVERNLLSQSIDRTYATIPNVASNDNGYYAIFPSICVRTMNLTTGTAQINVPSTQSYKTVTVGGQVHQRVDMPMAAFTTGDVLQFKNLACIVKVTVKNDIPQSDPNYGPLAVERIVVTGDGTFPVAGLGTVDIAAGTLNMGGYVSNVILTGEYNNAMETLEPGAEHPFYIIVPAFTRRGLTIKVETTTGKYREYSLSGVTATASHMASLTLQVNTLTGGGDAYLDEGPTVNAILRNLATNEVNNIRFWYTTGLPAGYTLGTDAFRVDLQRDGDIPIYVFKGPIEPLTGKCALIFSTLASHIYANANSSYLFANLNKIASISSFDPNFITDNVTNMSYMFAYTSEYSDLTSNNKINPYGIEAFNTTHVTTMAHMFENNKVSELDLSHFSSASLTATGMIGMFNGCSNLLSLDLTSFYTSQVTNMDYLFNGCTRMQELHINNFDMNNVSSMTDMCKNLCGNYNSNNTAHIWCTPDVQSDMSGLSDFDPTSVTWHNTVVQ